MLIIAMHHPSHCCVNSAFSSRKVFTTLAQFNQDGSWNVKAHNIYSGFTACFFVNIQQVLWNWSVESIVFPPFVMLRWGYADVENNAILCWGTGAVKDCAEDPERSKMLSSQSVGHFGLAGWTGSGDSSVVRAPGSWSEGRGFESRQERREFFLLKGQLSVLTFISVSVPPPCYRSST